MRPGYGHPRVTAGGADDSTGSKVTGSRYTGTMSLPVDRKLPILASALGLLVLLVIMGVVLLGRGSAETHAASAGASSTAPGASSGVATAATTGSGITTADPLPVPSTGAAADTTDTAPSASAMPAPSTAAAHTAVAAHTAHPPPPPVTAKTAAPPPPIKKSCDPPYTLDSNGRKKYKLECM
ncbi:MAG: hypothetical protein NVS3B10_19790 [Polyangiales bacterium]